MKPLRRDILDPAQLERHKWTLIAKWRDGDREVRERFPAGDLSAAQAAITDFLTLLRDSQEIWTNNVYQVNVTRSHQPVGPVVHISVKRRDKQPIHDWRDLQEIKNQIVGPECEAVELYPAESRKVDSANQYHLWACPDPKFRFPFGYTEREVTDKPFLNSVNRPFKGGSR